MAARKMMVPYPVSFQTIWNRIMGRKALMVTNGAMVGIPSSARMLLMTPPSVVKRVYVMEYTTTHETR